MNPPPGFAPLFRTSPVLDLIGPLYSRGRGAGLAIGFRVEAKHCNARGTIHGGIERIARASAVFLVSGER